MAHTDMGDELNSTWQHYHQELYLYPMPQHGMERCGVDNLHLIYLNTFKHLFKYTKHNSRRPTNEQEDPRARLLQDGGVLLIRRRLPR